jgi:hypothetical protein
MNMDITSLIPETCWSVIFKDEGNWRMGLYKPEFTGPDDIDVLEKHTCPEVFICLQGKMGLVLCDGFNERIVELQPLQALMVTDYHNGFAIDPDGYFLVTERTAFTTEYIDRKTGSSIKKVVVK